tara:strand:+ start:721 stop:1440 length:720 start_codon:yes stop_codon:yes gene_type:complete
MHILTIILLFVLVVLILSHTIDGFTTYNWRIPNFDNTVTTEEVQVERKNKPPTAYASVPIRDADPINLKDIDDMLVDNRNVDNFAMVLDKLNDIDDKLIQTGSRYTCTNIYGNPDGDGSDGDGDDRVIYDCKDKILSHDILENKCNSRGCSGTECCVDNVGQPLFKFFRKKCLPISSDNNQANEQEKIYSTESLCNSKNKPCSKADVNCPADKTNINKDFLFCDATKANNQDCIDICCK